MTRHSEPLDETIDRVAAALTLVPADPTLAARIADRLETQPASTMFNWRQMAIASVAVAALALIATAVLREQRVSVVEPPAPVVQHSSPAATPQAPPVRRSETPTQVALALAINSQPASRSRLASANVQPSAASDVPRLDALRPPAQLAVDGLTTNPLTIAPVEITPLDLAGLAISDVAGRDDPKE